MKKKSTQKQKFFEFCDFDGSNPVKILAASQAEAAKALANAEGSWVFTGYLPRRHCGCVGG